MSTIHRLQTIHRLLTMRTFTTLILAAAIVQGVGGQGDGTLAVSHRSNSAPWVAASGSFVAVSWGAMAAGRS
jgi:hypothetical protein